METTNTTFQGAQQPPHDVYAMLMNISNQNAATLAKLESIYARLDVMYNDHKELEDRVKKLEAKENKRTGVIATVAVIASVLVSFLTTFIKGEV